MKPLIHGTTYKNTRAEPGGKSRQKGKIMKEITTSVIELRGRKTAGQLGYSVSVREDKRKAIFIVTGTEKEITGDMHGDVMADDISYSYYYMDGVSGRINKLWSKKHGAAQKREQEEVTEFLRSCIGLPIKYADGIGKLIYTV